MSQLATRVASLPFRKKGTPLGLIALVALVAVLCGPPPAQASPVYTYSVLAKSGDVIDGVTLGAIREFAISDNGQEVAFTADVVGGSGVFTPTSLLARSGDVIGGVVVGSAVGPSINNSGEVVFNGANSILTPTSKIAAVNDTIDGRLLKQIVSAPSINNSGTIAFRATHSAAYRSAIFSQGAVMIDYGDSVGGGRILFAALGSKAPGLNNNDVAAFEGYATTSPNNGIFATDNTTLALKNDIIGGIKWNQLAVGGAGPVLNDSGEFAFVGGGYDAGIPRSYPFGGVLYASGRVVARQDDVIGGNTLALINSSGSGHVIDINNPGQVAFTSSLVGGGRGAFVEQSEVAVTGDTILGRTVDTVYNNIAIADAGQVLFVADLDGECSLVQATLEPWELIGGAADGTYQATGFIDYGYPATGMGPGPLPDLLHLENFELDPGNAFATLKFHYDANDVAVRGIPDDSMMRLYWWDADDEVGNGQRWYLGGTTTDGQMGAGVFAGVDTLPGDFGLGYHGVDTVSDYVWANINHASEYAMAAGPAGDEVVIPEPISTVFMASAFLIVAWRARRRKTARRG